MNRIRIALIVVAPLVALGTSTYCCAQGAGPYSTKDVYQLLHDGIRQSLGIPENDPTSPMWLSLSTVGSIVNASDQSQVNDLANFCPPASAVLQSYDRIPHLDEIYSRLNDFSIGPKREFSKEYYAALQWIKTHKSELAQYEKYFSDNIKLVQELQNTRDAPARVAAALKLQQHEQQWKDEGFKYEVEHNRALTEAEEKYVGTALADRRSNVLKSYKNLGLKPTDASSSFLSPLSTFTPAPDSWPTLHGATFTYSAENNHVVSSASGSSSSGFAGLSLGFVNLVGSGGGGNGSSSRVEKIYKFSYDIELIRVKIQRGWFDNTLFFEPIGWTWKKMQSAAPFPFVSGGKSDAGQPIAPTTHLYDNKNVGCSLVPLEVIVAKHRRVSATTSTDDYSAVQNSGSSGGGGSLFGIFGGGGSRSWHSTVVTQDKNFTSFEISDEGTAVIGVISQVVPLAPNPNLSDVWPPEAWLPATSDSH